MTLYQCPECDRVWPAQSAAETCEQICTGTAYLNED